MKLFQFAWRLGSISHDVDEATCRSIMIILQIAYEILLYCWQDMQLNNTHNSFIFFVFQYNDIYTKAPQYVVASKISRTSLV